MEFNYENNEIKSTTKIFTYTVRKNYWKVVVWEGCLTCVNWLILVVFVCDKLISTRVMMQYHSNSPVCMGPHLCVNSISCHGCCGYSVMAI